jgi:hypothetical protein
VARASSADVALHLDHITNVDLMRLAPELGFSSVMYDGFKSLTAHYKCRSQTCRVAVLLHGGPPLTFYSHNHLLFTLFGWAPHLMRSSPRILQCLSNPGVHHLGIAES